MGIQATNSYNLTIPIGAVEAIFAEYQPTEFTYNFGMKGTYEPVAPSVEALVRVIGQEFGNDDTENPDYTDGDGVIHIEGFTAGRLGDAENLAQVLAKHGATGIIHGEADGELFLLEFAEGTMRVHGGQVVFPTYKGSLLG